MRPPSPQRPSPVYGSLPPLPRGLALYPVDPLPANLYHRDTPPLLASAEGVGDRGFGMGSLEDLGSVGHALSALSYGRDTAACCAAEIAVHACERVSKSTQGELVLFLMAAPASGRSAVVLYGGQHAQQCDDSEQNNIATGMRLIMGSLRTAAAPPDLDPTGASLTPPASPLRRISLWSLLAPAHPEPPGRLPHRARLRHEEIWPASNVRAARRARLYHGRLAGLLHPCNCRRRHRQP